MTRVKFLVFALAVLGLWMATFTTVAPTFRERAVELAAKHVAGAPAAVALRLEGRRLELQRAIFKVAGSPAAFAAAKPGAKGEAPTSERLALIQAVVIEALPEGLRGLVLVGLANESGALWARGAEVPSNSAEILDVAKFTAAGADGAMATVFGATHLFYSLPVYSGEKLLATVVVGGPALPQGTARAVAKDLGLAAAAISSEGKVLEADGPERSSVEKIDKVVKLGQAGITDRGALLAMGPFQLPLGTSGDTLGGKAPRFVGLRQAIGGSPYEVAATVSLEPAMRSLADYQRMAIFSFAGLVLLSIAFTVILGRGKFEFGHDDSDEPSFSMPKQAPRPVSKEVVTTPGLAMPELPPAPEASPDDFQFGPSAAAPEPGSAPGPSIGEGAPEAASPIETPFDSPGLVPGTSPADFEAAFPAGAAFTPFESSSEPGIASVRGAASDTADPFASTPQSQQQSPYPHQYPEGQSQEASGDNAGDQNPEATRVASVPQELLQASARPSGTHEALVGAESRSGSGTGAGVDDQHFHDVYRDFVATRERCGEAADGLTFEKFATKLKRNREQLIAKHSCRTVRFQVYVKDGKAALKATPIKD